MNTEIGYLILSLAGILSTVLIFLIKSCFKSKCDQVDLCCLKIHRNTSQESQNISSPQLILEPRSRVNEINSLSPV
jgi:hypothetical protein